MYDGLYCMWKETVTEPDVRQIEVERRKCRFPDENYLDVAKLYTFESCKLQCQKNEHMSLYNCTHLYMPFASKQIYACILLTIR